MISRLLRRRQEPGSIFEHIDAHVRPGVAGLAEGGERLPDEDECAVEGILGGVGGDDTEAIERIYAALAALAARPSAANRSHLRELFREGRVRARIDGVRERLGSDTPPHTDRLYPELRELLVRSCHRDEVKYAIGLVSGFGQHADADVFRVLGRHEEFTLYAAVALMSVSDDPVGEWLALLPHVRGWGRTELSELILRELPRFPGVGGALLEPSLQSPVVRHRFMALRALSTWEHLPAELMQRVAEARTSDPDEQIRAAAARVLAGEPFPQD